MVFPSLVKQFQILLLFWLGAIVSARDVQIRDDISTIAWERSLERRQDSSFEPILDASCRYKCVARSCGDSCAAVTKREYIPLDHAERPYNLTNEKTGEWYNVSQEEYHSDLARRGEIYKRAFEIDPRWTTARIRAYLRGQVLPGPDGVVRPLDGQFIGNKGFYAGGPEAEVTVSYQGEFGNTAFQYGTGGLHGCTMLTIVSNRAVWMAHFWEAYAFGENEGPLVPGSEDQINFQVRVLNAMSGTGEQDGSYAVPVDWTQFNQPGDNTRAIFMTPVNPATTQSNPSALYKDRIILIHNLITANIPGVATQIFRYNPLNYYYDPDTNTYSGPDRNLVDTTERGMAAFQYDGAGNWRLFYEAMMYRNGDAIEDTPQVAFK